MTLSNDPPLTHHPNSNGSKSHPRDAHGQTLTFPKGTTKIKIPSTANLTSFPRQILTHFSTLTTLDLSGNSSLSSLPKDISRLHNLKIAFFSNCSFKVFPKELAQCRSLEMVAFKGNGMREIREGSFPRRLRWLILTGNELETLPGDLGACGRLEKCMLAGNRLRALPGSMASCRKLGLLRLSSNQFESLPAWLFEMPELAFLSFAGNPCSDSANVQNPVLDEISWEDLEVQHLLGEGASGVISKGLWNRPGGEKEVALKIFKGALTSDGSPLDEMNATILAGQHANLINPLGRIHAHPENAQGLVMQLIPSSYTNLGLPPSMQSCTRDCFPEDVGFGLFTVLSILRGIASAAAHLHSRNILHGDLYAHNILLDRASGHALLGDFGAATTYASFDGEGGEGGEGWMKKVEKLEVLAFGHLVEDLLGLVEWRVDGVMEEKEMRVLEGLNGVHWRCVGGVVGERPGFKEVVEVLEEI